MPQNSKLYIATLFKGTHFQERLSLAFSKKNLRLSAMRLSARLVMVAYTLLLLKPAMPVIVDNLEHSFNTAEHFRIVHVHGGKEHVHYTMEKNAKNDGHDKTGLRHHLGDEMPAHLAIHSTFEIEALGFNSFGKALLCYQRDHESVRCLPDFPPPKAG